jgi:hypothetical protein
VKVCNISSSNRPVKCILVKEEKLWRCETFQSSLEGIGRGDPGYGRSRPFAL